MPTLIRFAPAVAIAALVSGCRPSSAPALAPLTLPFAVDSQRTASPRPGIVHRFVYASAGPWAINILEGHANRCWSLAALKSSGEAVGRERTSQLARTATERANGIWKQLLTEYVPPPLDPGAAETLDAFIERLRREIMRAAG